MPILQNPRHEAFAFARAQGATLLEAYEDAGFSSDRSHAARLAGTEAVAERIGELRQARNDAQVASPHAIMTALVNMATNEAFLKNPAAAREARQNLLEAHRLHLEMAMRREKDRKSYNVYF